MPSINELLDSASARYDSALVNARKAVRIGGGSGSRGSIAGPYGPAIDSRTGGGIFGATEDRSAVKQYKALKDIPFTAIRPIAVRVADQSFKVGTKISASGKPKGMMTKQAARLVPPTNLFRKAIAEGIETIEDHPLLDALENPNPYMSGWALKWCTAISLQATGRAYWLSEYMLSADAADGGDGERTARFWYLPAHWVKPVHENGKPFAGWKIVPPNTQESDAKTLPADAVLPFFFPNPENPTDSLSPMQTQARAINTDDEVQKAQYSSMINSVRPSVVIAAGRMEMPQGGQGPRPVLTPEQREQVVQSIRSAYAGAMHSGEPIIVDGLIESVTPFLPSPAEMDFLNGSKLTKDRIMQGIGTNPIVAGQIENANRASAYVAQDIFNANVVNPTITLISETLTKQLGPVFANAGEKLYVWIERAEAQDVDLQNARVGMLVEAKAITKNELREFADMAPMAEGGDELAGPPDPPPMGAPPDSPPQKPGKGAAKSMLRLMKTLSRRVEFLGEMWKFDKAYNPKQPRIAKGKVGGGRFASGSGAGSKLDRSKPVPAAVAKSVEKHAARAMKLAHRLMRSEMHDFTDFRKALKSAWKETKGELMHVFESAAAAQSGGSGGGSAAPAVQVSTSPPKPKASRRVIEPQEVMARVASRGLRSTSGGGLAGMASRILDKLSAMFGGLMPATAKGLAEGADAVASVFADLSPIEQTLLALSAELQTETDQAKRDEIMHDWIDALDEWNEQDTADPAIGHGAGEPAASALAKMMAGNLRSKATTQPREPAGTSTGGQFASNGGGGSAAKPTSAGSAGGSAATPAESDAAAAKPLAPYELDANNVTDINIIAHVAEENYTRWARERYETRYSKKKPEIEKVRQSVLGVNRRGQEKLDKLFAEREAIRAEKTALYKEWSDAYDPEMKKEMAGRKLLEIPSKERQEMMDRVHAITDKLTAGRLEACRVRMEDNFQATSKIQNQIRERSHKALQLDGPTCEITVNQHAVGGTIPHEVARSAGLMAVTDTTVASRIKEGAAFFDGIVSEAHGTRKTINAMQIEPDKDQRPFHAAINGISTICIGSGTSPKVVAHEIGHSLDQGNTLDISKGFLAKRVGKEAAVPLDKAFPNHGYAAGEYGREDKFFKTFGNRNEAHYAGKHYPFATEVLSMGIEKLYDDPGGFAKNDPEYFNFVVGVLHGHLIKE